MKLIVISDTHNLHKNLTLPYGDVIIHCGDFTNYGEYHEVKDFFDWFSALPHEHKIVIPGNHEVGICPLKNKNLPLSIGTIAMIRSYKDIHFLVDEQVIIETVKFYGSPWCGGDAYIMNRWGFYLETDDERRIAFSRIPRDTDVLITHSPPFGILDVYNKMHLGCKELLNRVKLVKPVLHLFGHIHESSGLEPSDYTEFYNCAQIVRIINL